MNNGREIMLEEIAEAIETAKYDRTDAEKQAAIQFCEQLTELYNQEDAAKRTQEKS